MVARNPLTWTPQVIAGHPRTFVGLLAGLAAWVLLPRGWSGELRAIVAWDVGALVFLALAAVVFSGERLRRMAQDARRQQEGEWTIFAVTVLGAAACFGALLGEFSGLKDLPRAERNLHVGLVTATLALTWLLTHTVFAFRYAHEYYERARGAAHPDGGLEFPGKEQPDYWDFFYFAAVLGMTFQVSDVQITSRKLRRLATVHGLLSFAFNTVILALTVNIAAGLL